MYIRRRMAIPSSLGASGTFDLFASIHNHDGPAFTYQIGVLAALLDKSHSATSHAKLSMCSSGDDHCNLQSCFNQEVLGSIRVCGAKYAYFEDCALLVGCAAAETPVVSRFTLAARERVFD